MGFTNSIGPESGGPEQKALLWGLGDLFLILGFSVAYFAATTLLAGRGILFTDELVTLYMAKLPSAIALWEALSDGADTLPPMGHYTTRVAIQLLGDSHVAIRLPAILGYWLMSVCIYLFVRAYTPVTYAGVAMLTPLSTMAYGGEGVGPYAYFARPYGLMLGFGAAVLLCWQRACEGRYRLWWLIGLALSLAAALASHWYAVLVLIPLGLGELVRLRARRRPDGPMWAALALGMASLLAFLPMIRNARTYQPVMSKGVVGVTAVVDAYQALLNGTSPLFLAILLILAWLASGSSNAGRDNRRAGNSRIPSEVLAALVGLLLTPVSGAILASAITGVYSPRYMLLAVIGIAIGVGLATQRLGGWRRTTGIILLATAGSASLFQIYQSKIALRERSAIVERAGLFAILGCSTALEDSEEPIVVTDVHSYYILQHYASATLAKRLVYLTEYNALASRMSRGMKHWSPWKIIEYRDFISNNFLFLIYESQYSSSQTHSPLLARLVADGARITDSGCIDARDVYPRPGSLYRVKMPMDRMSREVLPPKRLDAERWPHNFDLWWIFIAA
jgi:hypothetical protein